MITNPRLRNDLKTLLLHGGIFELFPHFPLLLIDSANVKLKKIKKKSFKILKNDLSNKGK